MFVAHNVDNIIRNRVLWYALDITSFLQPMSRQTLLIVILILLVVGVVGYWYVIHQNNVSGASIEDIVATTTAADTVQKAKTEVDQKDTVVSNEMEFDPTKVQPGEKFGAFTVTKSNYDSITNSYYAYFKGPATIQGTLSDTEMGMCDAMIEVSPSTLDILPWVTGKKAESTLFYLGMEGIPDEEQPTYNLNEKNFTTRSGQLLQEGDTVEVTVDTLSRTYVGKDCSGSSIQVTSLKKISS